jgi:ribosomal protein S21
MVEVTNDDLERAIRKMKRRLKDDNGIKLLREREYYRKPSELKVLARKERDKRIAKKEFRSKLKWITNRRSRGF